MNWSPTTGINRPASIEASNSLHSNSLKQFIEVKYPLGCEQFQNWLAMVRLVTAKEVRDVDHGLLV
ncbi:MAG: hypothetical protein NT069_28320, partial [Planctomycetota bacterium]|nr:hypothetical protein [Planctomycetota bacterium]